MTGATIETTADTVILNVGFGVDKTVSWAAGRTVQSVIDEINQRDPSTRARRWKAGVGDINPQTIIGAGAGEPSAAADAALGYEDALYPTASPGNFLYVAAGTDRANRGGGAFLPLYDDTDYDYPIVNTAVPAQGVGRGGGIDADLGEDILRNRRSAFGVDSPLLENRAQEANPAFLKFESVLENVTTDVEFGAAENRRISVYSWRNSTPVYQAIVGGSGPVSVSMNVAVVGPVFVELSGAAFGAPSATGTYSISGAIRLQ